MRKSSFQEREISGRASLWAALAFEAAALGLLAPEAPDAGEPLGWSEAAVLLAENAREAMEKGDLEGAEAMLDQALAFEPRFPDALALKGDCRSGLGHPESARGLYQRALDLVKTGARPLRIDAAAIEGRLKKIPEPPPADPTPGEPAPAENDRPTALLLCDAARQALEGGDEGKALALARRACEASPSLPDAWVLAGDLRRRRGEVAGALEDFRKAKDAMEKGGRPENVTAAEIEARIEEAAPGLPPKETVPDPPADPPPPSGTRPPSGDPETAALLCEAAREALEKGNAGEARRLAEKARRVSRDFPEAAVLLGDAHSVRGEAEKALYYYRMAQECIAEGTDPGRARPEEIAGKVRAAGAEASDASEKYSKAALACAESLEAFAERKEHGGWRRAAARIRAFAARLRGKEGFTSRPIPVAFPEGLFAFPPREPGKRPDLDVVAAWVDKARANADPAAALDDIRKALSYDPENPAALVLAADLLEKAGDSEGALEGLRRALFSGTGRDPKAPLETWNRRIQALDGFSPDWATIREEGAARLETAAKDLPEGRWRQTCLLAGRSLRGLRPLDSP